MQPPIKTDLRKHKNTLWKACFDTVFFIRLCHYSLHIRDKWWKSYIKTGFLQIFAHLESYDVSFLLYLSNYPSRVTLAGTFVDMITA